MKPSESPVSAIERKKIAVEWSNRHGLGLIPTDALAAFDDARTALSQSRPTETHTDHPLRHFDRTCPACIAGARTDVHTISADSASSTEEIASEQDAMRFFDRETDEVGWREAIRKLYRIVKAQSAASAIELNEARLVMVRRQAGQITACELKDEANGVEVRLYTADSAAKK